MRTVTALAFLALALVPGRARAEWSGEKIESIAKRFAEKIAMPIDKAQPALARLREKLISEPDLVNRTGGIVAYQMGEGGLIIKVKKGKGAVYFRRGGDHDFELKSLSVGANVGGSSEWGVGILVDLGSEGAFGGKYKGSIKGATAGDASLSVTDLHRSDTSDPAMAHRFILIGSATGLSANAGEA